MPTPIDASDKTPDSRRFDLNFRATRTSNVPSMFARTVPPAALLVLTALSPSCRKPEIQTYRVAKDPVTATPDAGTSNPHAHAAAPTSAPPAPGPAATPGGSSMAGATVPTAAGPG